VRKDWHFGSSSFLLNSKADYGYRYKQLRVAQYQYSFLLLADEFFIQEIFKCELNVSKKPLKNSTMAI
jgi:hypothetical protein